MNGTVNIDVLADEPIGTINPYLHGHFAEHLGLVVHPGIWVGEDSSITNVRGIRKDVVDALKPLSLPVLRWPGGCFADDYHWRDGIGPRDQRPVRINRHWGHDQEPNQFGTHEFIDFCRQIGTEPYFAANVGSGTPKEVRDWVEYCNFAGYSSLSEERRANGDDAPFGVRFWGIGNENWYCGGNMSPEEYAADFCRYRNYVSDYSGTKVEAIACGPNNADWDWTRRFFEKMRKDYVNRLPLVGGFAAHYYCRTAGTATEYTDDQWLELLARAYAIEGVITGTRALMDEHDPERKIPLLMDEWGTWHPVETGRPPRGLYQQNTIRDACVAALTLDRFHAHADKLMMGNIAQLINVLQALLLVDEDHCIKTPTYHVFDLYRPHQGATSVRLVTDAESVTDGGPSADFCRTRYREEPDFGLPGVQGSASVKEGKVCVTLVNSHPRHTYEVRLKLRGAGWGRVERVDLVHQDLRAHNTPGEPVNVRLSSSAAPALSSASEILVNLGPGAITRLLG